MIVALLLNSGCVTRYPWKKTVGNDTTELERVLTRKEQPEAEIYPASFSSAPVTVREEFMLENLQYRDVSLSETVTIAMQNSNVLRERGGVLLKNPESVASQYNPGVWQTDPRFSPEAALSAFDAQLAATSYFTRRTRHLTTRSSPVERIILSNSWMTTLLN